MPLAPTLADCDGNTWTYRSLTDTWRVADCGLDGCGCGGNGLECSLQDLSNRFGPLAGGPMPAPMPSIP
jgi:hypothetical protein